MVEHQKFERRLTLVAERVGGLAKMAKEIGVHPNTLYRVKHAGGYPSAEVLIAIAEKHHVDLNWLLGVSDEEMG